MQHPVSPIRTLHTAEVRQAITRLGVPFGLCDTWLPSDAQAASVAVPNETIWRTRAAPWVSDAIMVERRLPWRANASTIPSTEQRARIGSMRGGLALNDLTERTGQAD